MGSQECTRTFSLEAAMCFKPSQVLIIFEYLSLDCVKLECPMDIIGVCLLIDKTICLSYVVHDYFFKNDKSDLDLG